MSKINTAIELVKANGMDKAASIAAIINALAVTKANAYIYFVKAIDRLGGEPTMVASTPMVSKVRKANEITGLSAAKAKIKIAEIDRALAKTLSNGARGPFAGL